MNASLSCLLARTSSSLTLTYAITNRESFDLGVFNRIPWNLPDGTLAFPPESAYVELADERLLVRLRALPVPDGLRMAAFVPPFTTKAAAGARFEERIVLPVPAKVMQPFQAAQLRLAKQGEAVADRPAMAKTLRLEVGVFQVGAGCRLVPEHPAHPNVLTALPPGPAVEKQQVLSFETRLDPPLQVLDYRVEAWP